MVPAFILAAILFRLVMLAVSRRHERALRHAGAEEFSVGNSALLTAAHIFFYLIGAAEALWRNDPPDVMSAVGLAIYLFGAAMLLVVVRLLGPLWTVKLMIATNHTLITHRLFRLVRHPNYFLNVLPEMVGYALTIHAYWTLLIGLPLYLIPLVRRIRLEERVMRERFAAY
jgi:isoprenylcysteine carboxyl methyltransferase (ICMT) family protein YpbQ